MCNASNVNIIYAEYRYIYFDRAIPWCRSICSTLEPSDAVPPRGSSGSTAWIPNLWGTLAVKRHILLAGSHLQQAPWAYKSPVESPILLPKCAKLTS